MTAVRVRVNSIRGNSREVLAAVAKRFWKRHNEGQQGLVKTTRRMVQALPWVRTKEQSEDFTSGRWHWGRGREPSEHSRREKAQGWIS